jgi:hypothetical protein
MEVVTDATFKELGARTSFSQLLKVPRQCQLVLLVEVRLRQGENIKF